MSPSSSVISRCFHASGIGLSLVSSGLVPNWKAIWPSSSLSIQCSHSFRFQTPPAMTIGTLSEMPPLAHRLAQRLDPRIGVLRRERVLGVGEAVMAAGQPGILVDHRRQPFGRLANRPASTSALKARAELMIGR